MQLGFTTPQAGRQVTVMKRYVLTLLLVCGLAPSHAEEPTLRLAVFDADATPPVGSELAYDTMTATSPLTLRCRGVVLQGAGEPIVLAAVDWIGVANAGHDFFRDALAHAAGTTRQRVALHAVHQHDAPLCDYSAAEILAQHGRPQRCFDPAITKPLIERAAASLAASLGRAQPVTHVGYGEAAVQEVASNRRLLGPDGKVKATRFTATKDPALRAEPEGIIDPIASVVSFWNGDRPLVALTYYTTHPQSYYRTGYADPDFPGIARFLRDQAVPGLLHIHFNGAGGNLGAGKYNDGDPANRPVLARRLADGLDAAWQATKKKTIAPSEVMWRVVETALPTAPYLEEEALNQQLADSANEQILGAAMRLAWLQRSQRGHKTDISLLQLGSTGLLHLPGELFVEYQLAAKALRPDLHLAVAAYGDYGPAYIGTTRSYSEGGYETEPRSSNVAPEVESVLMEALRQVLEKTE